MILQQPKSERDLPIDQIVINELSDGIGDLQNDLNNPNHDYKDLTRELAWILTQAKQDVLNNNHLDAVKHMYYAFAITYNRTIR